MKHTMYAALILSALIFTGCGIGNQLTTNHNLHNTEVQLSRNNFKVLKTVTATEEATYILGFGGMTKKALLANARAKVVKEAGLEGGSKALINETVEIHLGSMLVITKITITVSAQVIEFTS